MGAQNCSSRSPALRFPHPVHAFPHPVPAFPHPVPAFPHPVPAFPHPVPAFPHPVPDGLLVYDACRAGTIKSATKAKVAIFTCPLDISRTETKGTVLIKTGEQLLNFSKGEEDQLESAIKEIADSGVKVLVTGSGISEMALHFINRYELVATKVRGRGEGKSRRGTGAARRAYKASARRLNRSLRRIIHSSAGALQV